MTTTSSSSSKQRQQQHSRYDWNADGSCPIPLSISALYEDNRRLIYDILRTDPITGNNNTVGVGVSVGGEEDGSNKKKKNTDEIIWWKSRLVFIDDALRSLILRNVLRLPSEDGVSSVAAALKQNRARQQQQKKQRQQQQQQQQHMHQPNEPILPRYTYPLKMGIVGSRVLTRCKVPRKKTNDGFYNMNGGGGGDCGDKVVPATSSSGGMGSEVVLERSIQDDLDDDEDDELLMMQDENIIDYDYDDAFDDLSCDGANVIIYFLRPNPKHARFVSQKIKRLQDLFNRRRSAAIKRQREGGDGNLNKIYHRIVFLPHYTCICERVLLDEGVLSMDNVTTQECHLDLIPLDGDVLSMELPNVLRECDIDGCPSSCVTAIARSILKIQDLCGIIPRMQGLGPLAEGVISQVMSLRVQDYQEESDGLMNDFGTAALGSSGDEQQEEEKKAAESSSSLAMTLQDGPREIDALLVIDRKVDMITPMLTPLTYEGLVDELVGIDGGYINLDESMIEPDDKKDDENDDDNVNSAETTSKNKKKKKKSTNPFDDEDDDYDYDNENENENEKGGSKKQQQQQQGKKKNSNISLSLNNSDTLYAEVRNQNVEKFGSFLQNQAIALRESHGKFANQSSKKSRDLNEIHQFVKQIPVFTQSLRSLTLHIHLAELLKKTTSGNAFRERWHTERSMVEGEMCLDSIEDSIAYGEEPPFDVLRLLCLQSLTCGGLKSSKYDYFRREVIQTYGYEYLYVLQDLERIGAFRKKESASGATGAATNMMTSWVVDSAVAVGSAATGAGGPFATLRKTLNLIHAEVNNVEPDDASYVSSGYAPLTARLVQVATSTKGWVGKEEVLKALLLQPMPQPNWGGIGGGSASGGGGGGTSGTGAGGGAGGAGGILGMTTSKILIDVIQRDPPEELSAALKRGIPSRPMSEIKRRREQEQEEDSGKKKKKKPILMVYFVGGVTYMEIAALRFLSRRPKFPFDIVCCTTKVVNGTTLLHGICSN